MKLGFLVDTERCIGCHACEMACKNEYQPGPTVRMRKVYGLEEGKLDAPARVYASLACNHCDDPACLKACPTGAYTKQANGAVDHDVATCIGCQLCIMACPYNVPCYDPEIGKVRKCDLCYDRLEKGEQPACVENCVMDAIHLVDFDKEDLSKYDDTVPNFPDTRITKPNVRFVKAKIGEQTRRD